MLSFLAHNSKTQRLRQEGHYFKANLAYSVALTSNIKKGYYAPCNNEIA